MEFMNEHINVEALVRTLCTMPADTAQPLSPLGQSDTTLANWHKQHCHLHDPCCRVMSNIL